MAYEIRKNLFKSLEELRQRPVISYVTSSRINASGNMSSDVIPELIKQINLIEDTQKNIDILIVSNGGDPTVSWRIITMLRERFEKVGVLIPFAAYSAATLLALGADEIIMHPFSNLGPVDPQLHTIRKKGADHEIINFGSEDLRHYLDFLKNDVGLSDQDQLQKSFELVCNEIGAIPIGISKRSFYLALSMGEKLLSLHLDDKNKAKVIAEALNTSFYHHGYPLGRKEAKDIGLPIVNGHNQVEDVIWNIWEDYENEMNCNSPFNPLEVIFSNEELANSINFVPQADIPMGLPPQVLQEAYNRVLQQLNVRILKPVEHSIFQAALESSRARSEYKTQLKIFAARQPDLKIAFSVESVKQGWNFITE